VPYLGEVHIGTPPFGCPPRDDTATTTPKSETDTEQDDNSNNNTNDNDNNEENYDYEKSDYDLWLDRDADLAVDAARMGNEARFVNDYRGVPRREEGKKKANAEFRVVWDARTGEKGMAVFVLPAGKRATGKARTVGIRAGEEVLVSYGRGFWQERREGGDGGW